jgi:phosphatidylserine synthase
MTDRRRIPQSITTVLVYGRLPLVFGAMLCAVAVMWRPEPGVYLAGVLLLLIAMTFDLVDGWFAARFYPHPQMAQLADRILDKLIYSIIFPLVAVGAMWRLHYFLPDPRKGQLLHAMLVLFLAVTVLIRDNFAHFVRGVALRFDQELEFREFARVRTIVAAPLGFLLYAHAFYIPAEPASVLQRLVSQLGNTPLRTLFIIEIIFFIINIVSIAGLVRRYGSMCLDDLCLGNLQLRRQILAIFPNGLTLMNAAMGLLAVFFAYHDRLREASLFLIGAALFDKLDGALARRLGLTEPLPDAPPGRPRLNVGAVLDDVSDGISFCIAPAWIFYLLLDGIPEAGADRLPYAWAAVIYAAAGIARLVYFTVDKHPIPGFFKGMPTPAAAMLVMGPMLILGQEVAEAGPWVPFWAAFSCVTMFATAAVMNLYPVRYLHFGRFMSRHPWFTRMSFLILCTVFTPYYGYVFFLLMLVYLFSPLVTGRIDPRRAASEARAKST